AVSGPDPLHPCDQYARFPAACYRFLPPRLLAGLGQDRSKMQELCRRLPHSQRLGCFFGYGWSLVPWTSKRPDLFASECPSQPSDDRTMCIEGTIEFLAVFDKQAANAACETLRGDAAETCRSAAAGGAYRLDKPTLPLYLGQ